MNARRILVVDDDPDYTNAVSLLLQRDGHEVRCARDGPTAIDIAREYRPEVVLMDMGMPGRDGYAAALQDGRDLRLIAVDKSQVTASSFDAHLVKPVEPEHLRAALTLFDGLDHSTDGLAGVKGTPPSH